MHVRVTTISFRYFTLVIGRELLIYVRLFVVWLFVDDWLFVTPSYTIRTETESFCEVLQLNCLRQTINRHLLASCVAIILEIVVFGFMSMNTLVISSFEVSGFDGDLVELFLSHCVKPFSWSGTRCLNAALSSCSWWILSCVSQPLM
jgi:hypothetical protein